MRKIAFSFLIFAMLSAQKIVSAPRLDRAELKYSSSFTVPAASVGKEPSVSARAGMKLCVADLFFVNRVEARSYLTLPKTAFSDFDGFGGTAFGDVRYGVGVSFFGSSFPVQMKAGTISYAKSISKLKNPAPSALANPLKKSFAFSTGVGATLPTLTSAEQPRSVAFCLSFPGERFVLPLKAEAFVSEERNSALSVGTERSFGRFLSIKTALTGARFFVENTSSLLKKSDAACEGDFLCAFVWETNAHTPFLKTNFSLALHQSPYGRMGSWFKIDGRAVYKSALLDFSVFALPTKHDFPPVAPLIGLDSSIVRTFHSALVNPQFVLFMPGKSAATLRLGLSAFESARVCATKNAEVLCVGKARFGVEYESPTLALTCDLAVANVLLSGSPPNKSNTPERYYGASVGGNFFHELFCTAVSAGVKYYPPFDAASKDKKSIALDVSVVPKKWGFITFQSGFDVVFRADERTSAQFDSAVCIKTSGSRFGSSLNSSVKCALSVPF